MARPTNAASQATRTSAATPNFSVSGFGTSFDIFTNFLPNLSGHALIRDMFVMADTDETVGAMLYGISTTMRQITWDYVPQIDGVDSPEDPEAKKWADLATQMLKDMDQSFDDHVEDMLSMIWAGFAPIEMVFKRRDGVNSRFSDNYYGIGALNLIDQTTLWDIVYDGSKPVAFKQMAVQVTGDGIIPIAKLLLYRTTTQYNNPRGRPLLKNAWRVWRLKKKIQDSEALGIERELVGLPIFEMPEEMMFQQFETDETGELTEDAKRASAMVRAAQAATQDMRLNKSGGLVVPSDPYGDDFQSATAAAVKKYSFKILTSGGSRTIDSRTVARDYDHAIARVAMMQFLTLGQRSGGSYGLSEDQSSMAVSSIMALADKVTSEWNLKAVALTWLVNAFPDKYRPRLKHSDVNKNSIVQLGQFLGGLGKAADFWAGDAKMRRSLALAANLDYDGNAQEEAATTANAAADLQANPPPAPAPVAANAPPSKTAPKAARAPDEDEED